ncbi:DUF3052 domain-containing protein [Knoellia subterranea]|uniref:DUF3052 domain-containing protein n=1 Tax=Knoellia subterranea KCTC 19937 TaxID=1385521 RepID=A0A0A0JQN6_9MICO|nr:DUF3052 domain-containing protein [Knoellia subterranea]KGN38999.1 hypothetical protein N803_00255 [Knoellia subterranea KCTC 19937]
MNTAAPPPADTGPDGSGAVERLGFAAEQIVQEFGWDEDVDDDFRFAVEDVVGADLEDEDYTGEADAALLWWRADDGDLTDALINLVGVLPEGGFVIVLTPKDRTAGAVDPAEIDEAAATTGLHTAGAFHASPRWRATKLGTPKGRR